MLICILPYELFRNSQGTLPPFGPRWHDGSRWCNQCSRSAPWCHPPPSRFESEVGRAKHRTWTTPKLRSKGPEGDKDATNHKQNLSWKIHWSIGSCFHTASGGRCPCINPMLSYEFFVKSSPVVFLKHSPHSKRFLRFSLKMAMVPKSETRSESQGSVSPFPNFSLASGSSHRDPPSHQHRQDLLTGQRATLATQQRCENRKNGWPEQEIKGSKIWF